MYLFINIIGDILQGILCHRLFHCHLRFRQWLFHGLSDKKIWPVYFFDIHLKAVCSLYPLHNSAEFCQCPATALPQKQKCLTSNPLSQIVTANPRLQLDTHFAVDMFPYKKAELPKKPRNTPLFSLYLSFLDSKQTVSTWHDSSWLMSVFGNWSRLMWTIAKYLRLSAETNQQNL